MSQEWGIARPDFVGVNVLGIPRDGQALVGAGPLYIPRNAARVIVLHGESGGPWRYKAGDFRARSLTAANATTNVFTASAPHNFQTGDGPFKLAGSTLPAGAVAGTSYWVIVVDDDELKLAANYEDAMAGIPVDITTAGTPSGWFLPAALSVAAPGSSITDGSASEKLLVGERLVLAAPTQGLTIVGTAGADVLTYYFM
jgi:hypothetical protein